MTHTPVPMLYNQDTLADDDFVANFVARPQELDTLLRRLRSISPEESGQHHLVIGVRGMGKSSMLRRIAIAIAQEPALSDQFIPLKFREEQYNILSLGTFWRNCGEALAEWAEATGQDDLAARLDDAMATAAWAGDEAPAEQFAAELRALERRAVLLLDNLDLILSNLKPDDHWTLRRYLQDTGGPVVVGASPQALSQSADRDAAFYEFFQPMYLEPLDGPETERCMRFLATERGEAGKPVLHVLETQPERLRTLHVLTGGNPRVLTLIYRLLESADTEATMRDLEVLLDQVTPYYKHRVEEYQTAQQKAVIDAIALHWDPVTTGDLSKITNIPSTTLSSLLNRMRKDGLIETLETSGSYSGHQITERFFNIWYLMRHGTRRSKQKLRWLVGFLTLFYSPQELLNIFQRANSSGLALNIEYEHAVIESITRHYDALSNSDQTGNLQSEAENAYLRILLKKSADLLNKDEFDDALSCLDELSSKFGATLKKSNTRLFVDIELTIAFAIYEVGDKGTAINKMDKIFVEYLDNKDPYVEVKLAKSLFNKGAILEELGNIEEMVRNDLEIIDRYQKNYNQEISIVVLKAHLRIAKTAINRNHTKTAIIFFKKIVELFGSSNEETAKDAVAISKFFIGQQLFIEFRDLKLSEKYLTQSITMDRTSAEICLFWIQILTKPTKEAEEKLYILRKQGNNNFILLEVGLLIKNDNFGFAINYLDSILKNIESMNSWLIHICFVSIFRLVEIKGYTQKLLDWFQESGNSDRAAPLYIAFKAYIEDKNILLDVNPEVRELAELFYDSLDAPRRYAKEQAAKEGIK